MEGYVVKYHPGGWMKVSEDGLPDESGVYIVAIQTNLGLSDAEKKTWKGDDPEHAFDYITAAWFDYDKKLWQDRTTYTPYNALIGLKDVGKGEAVTYWQPVPTAPWRIFPK